MNGVRAAGLILAAFPLLISALEHYRESAEVLEDWWQIKRAYRKCKHEIKHQKLLFEGNLEEFLLPIIVDDEELKALIADPGGAQWKNPSLDDTLKERLPHLYDLYLETIKEIHGVMEELTRELGTDKVHFQNELAVQDTEKGGLKPNTGRSKLVSKANLEFQTQRIKFALGESSRNKLFDELSHYNKRLRDMLDTQDRLTALRSTGKKSKTSLSSKALTQFWRHADTLYSLLTRAWRCECETSHHANLLLQHRTSSAADFKILFSFSKAGCNQDPGAWKWQKTHLRLLNNEAKSIEIALPTSVSTDATSKNSPEISYGKPSIFRSSLLSRRSRPAKVCSEPANDNLTILRGSRILKPKVTWLDTEICPTSPPSVHDDRTVITDMCTTIAAYHPGISCFGILTDEETCYTVHPLTKLHSTHDPQDTVTLQMLLDKDFKISLNRRQRYSIALTLASSHLQLHSTPWLSAQWSKRDIVFLRDDEVPDTVIADQPYISRDFSPTNSSTATRDAHGDRSTSNLGIILLELCFGVALEDHKLRQIFVPSSGQSNPYLDLAMARDWCSSASAEAGPEFASAIEWCLQMNTVDVKSEVGRERLFTEVVEPLQYCHNCMNGRTGHI